MTANVPVTKAEAKRKWNVVNEFYFLSSVTLINCPPDVTTLNGCIEEEDLPGCGK